MSAGAIQDDGKTEDVFLTDGLVYRYNTLQNIAYTNNLVVLLHEHLCCKTNTVSKTP